VKLLVVNRHRKPRLQQARGDHGLLGRHHAGKSGGGLAGNGDAGAVDGKKHGIDGAGGFRDLPPEPVEECVAEMDDAEVRCFHEPGDLRRAETIDGGKGGDVKCSDGGAGEWCYRNRVETGIADLGGRVGGNEDALVWGETTVQRVGVEVVLVRVGDEGDVDGRFSEIDERTTIGADAALDLTVSTFEAIDDELLGARGDTDACP